MVVMEIWLKEMSELLHRVLGSPVDATAYMVLLCVAVTVLCAGMQWIGRAAGIHHAGAVQHALPAHLAIEERALGHLFKADKKTLCKAAPLHPGLENRNEPHGKVIQRFQHVRMSVGETVHNDSAPWELGNAYLGMKVGQFDDADDVNYSALIYQRFCIVFGLGAFDKSLVV